MSAVTTARKSPSNATFNNKEKPQEVRKANIVAAKAVADAIRTSLGPKGMDKMIKTKDGKVIISNDGHTILKHMAVLHPVAKMLVDLSGAQDVEAGDGTTSVVVLAGALLGAAQKLLSKGIHPTIVAESFQRAAQRSSEILKGMSHEISLEDREQAGPQCGLERHPADQESRRDDRRDGNCRRRRSHPERDKECRRTDEGRKGTHWAHPVLPITSKARHGKQHCG